MSEKFRGYHISEESEEYQKYKESSEAHKSGSPTTAYGLKEMKQLSMHRASLKRYDGIRNGTIDHYLAPDVLESQVAYTERQIRETQEDFRKYLRRRLEHTGLTRSTALFFKEGLNIEKCKSLAQKYDDLDEIYKLPDEYKMLIALNEGELNDEIIEALQYSIVEKHQAEYHSILEKLIAEGKLTAETITEASEDNDKKISTEYKNLSAATDALKAKAKTIDNAHIPDTLLEEIALEHIANYKEKETALLEYEKTFRQKYLEAAKKAIADGWLPVSLDVVEKRLNETKIVLKDVMNMHSPDTGGDHSSQDFEIRVSSIIPKTGYDAMLFHEATHAISGKTIIKHDNSSWDLANIKPQKVGVSFGIQYDYSNNRFTWLNEAITEEISMRLRQSFLSDSYREERELLNGLYIKGIDKQLVYNAYFENYDTKADTQTPIPKWKALTENIKKVFDWETFVDYDHYYNQKSIKKKSTNVSNNSDS